VSEFLIQFGISDQPTKKHWHHENILDDPPNKPIRKHYVSYAGGGPNTRSTQLFIAYEDLDFLGKAPWEVPFGEVTSGGDVLELFYTGYGDIPPFGKGPDQGKIHNRGNTYIRTEFPLIDFINSCSILPPKEKLPEEPQQLPHTFLRQEPVRDVGIIEEKEAGEQEFEAEVVLPPEVVSDEKSRLNHSALTAIVLLVVALAVLSCLYQYHSSPISPKSQ
jgi:cyclophilin family peptidyl-prolyl cis-trans isomerase